jgi:hypothetical protein
MSRKKLLAAMVLLVTLFSLMITGCSNKSEDKEKSVEFKSEDGSESITAPSSWKVETELNDDASIQIAKEADEKYVIVIKDSKELLEEDMQLSEYADLVKSTFESSITNVDSSEAKETTVDGNPALYFDISGEANDLDVSYMYTCVETSDSFYQIMGWTLTSMLDDNKDEILDVMNSFTTK